MTSTPLSRIYPFFLNLPHFILPFVVLLVFLELGVFIQTTLRTWIPGSVIGMGLLYVALSSKLVPDGMLDALSGQLLDRLGLFFVCPGVEVIKYLGLVESHWGSLLVAIVGSSVVTIVATGWVGDVNIGRKERREHKE
jgi:holin-like protein